VTAAGRADRYELLDPKAHTERTGGGVRTDEARD
jgi:hypothetical protein